MTTLFANDKEKRMKWVFASLCERGGKLDSALSIYHQLLEDMKTIPFDNINKEYYRLYFNAAQVMAKLWRKGGDEERSKLCCCGIYDVHDIIRVYQKALEFNPFLTDIYVNVSGLLITERLSDEAVEWTLNGINYLPKTDEGISGDLETHKYSLYTNLNIALRQVGKLQTAIEMSWEVIHLNLPTYNYPVPTKTSTASLEIEIVCVKYGHKYSADYVNNLFRMVNQACCAHRGKSWNSFQPQFICYTEDPNGIQTGIEIRPFSNEGSASWKGWWRKAQVFEATPYQDENRWILYLDLDTVIIQSIDHILLAAIRFCEESSYQPEKIFFTLDASQFRNEGRPRGINSSVMLWKANTFAEIFCFLMHNYDRITNYIFKWDHYLEMMLLCSVSDDRPQVVFLQDILPNFIIDYGSYSLLEQKNEHLEYGLICFPLSPKPHEISYSDQLYQIWMNGRKSIPSEPRDQELIKEQIDRS